VAKVGESTTQICVQLGLEDTGLDRALIVSAPEQIYEGRHHE
jgi:hypothetical protein